MRRVGVMGGTFDPIHLAHLIAASQAAYACDLGTVVFCAAGEPWHKGAATFASGEDRHAMVKLAVADDPRFVASRVDIDRSGPTYTVDTLRDLRAHWAEMNGGEDAIEWFFITGADALADVMSWREPDEIVRLAHLVGLTRPGHELRDPGLPSGSVTLVAMPEIDIASTDVRARIADGAPITYLVPPAVERYIAEHGLYRDV